MGAYSIRCEEILSPLVGKTVAGTCVRATAISLGKTWEELGPEDSSPLCENVRKLLAPIAPASSIQSVLARLQEAVR